MPGLFAAMAIAVLGATSPAPNGPPVLDPDVADQTLSGWERARSYVIDGGSASLGNGSPYISVLASHDGRFSHSLISFHRTQIRQESGDFEYVWMARERSADYASVVTRYADSRNCPAVGHALNVAEQIERPTIDLPGIPIGGGGQPSPADINMDDYTFTLKSRGAYRLSGAYAELTMSGDSGSPVGAWARMAAAALAPCWASQQPADLNPD